MANPIHCDIHDQAHLADVLVSQLASGDTMAACTEGYLELCRAYVQAADAADQDAQAETDAMTRLLDVAANVPAESAATSGEATAAPGEPGQPAAGQDAQELTERPPETETAPTGRSRRSGADQAGETIPA